MSHESFPMPTRCSRSSIRCDARRWPRTILLICGPAASMMTLSAPRDCALPPLRRHGYSVSTIRRRWSSLILATQATSASSPISRGPTITGGQSSTSRCAAASTISTYPAGRRHACSASGLRPKSSLSPRAKRSPSRPTRRAFRRFPFRASGAGGRCRRSLQRSAGKVAVQSSRSIPT